MIMPSSNSIYDQLQSYASRQEKQFAVLIDPDKTEEAALRRLIERSVESRVDYFFVGSSLLMRDLMDECIRTIKAHCHIPVILFPGNTFQINPYASAILLLSLISGRNAELLIGQHVTAASYLKASGLEIIPTGYMLIDGGVPTSVSYVSNTTPIPANKTDIAVCTALAGEMLGLQALYLEAGSGARYPVSEPMISAVKRNTLAPLIVGGGIRTPEKAQANCRAGADIIVIGNALEKDGSRLTEMAAAIHASPAIASQKL